MLKGRKKEGKEKGRKMTEGERNGGKWEEGRRDGRKKDHRSALRWKQ